MHPPENFQTRLAVRLENPRKHLQNFENPALLLRLLFLVNAFELLAVFFFEVVVCQNPVFLLHEKVQKILKFLVLNAQLFLRENAARSAEDIRKRLENAVKLEQLFFLREHVPRLFYKIPAELLVLLGLRNLLESLQGDNDLRLAAEVEIGANDLVNFGEKLRRQQFFLDRNFEQFEIFCVEIALIAIRLEIFIFIFLLETEISRICQLRVLRAFDVLQLADAGLSLPPDALHNPRGKFSRLSLEILENSLQPHHQKIVLDSLAAVFLNLNDLRQQIFSERGEELFVEFGEHDGEQLRKLLDR